MVVSAGSAEVSVEVGLFPLELSPSVTVEVGLFPPELSPPEATVVVVPGSSFEVSKEVDSVTWTEVAREVVVPVVAVVVHVRHVVVVIP